MLAGEADDGSVRKPSRSASHRTVPVVPSMSRIVPSGAAFRYDRTAEVVAVRLWTRSALVTARGAWLSTATYGSRTPRSPPEARGTTGRTAVAPASVPPAYDVPAASPATARAATVATAMPARRRRDTDETAMDPPIEAAP